MALAAEAVGELTTIFIQAASMGLQAGMDPPWAAMADPRLAAAVAAVA